MRRGESALRGGIFDEANIIIDGKYENEADEYKDLEQSK